MCTKTIVDFHINSHTVYSLLRANLFLQIEHFGQSPLPPTLLVLSMMLFIELVEPTSWQNCGEDCSADELSLLSIICDADIIR